MYFDKFPLIEYLDRLEGDTKTRIVTDILRRVQIKTTGKDENSFYVDYYLTDGDTPENISHRLYDTPSFFWVVLMVNDAINPYYDFSLSNVSLENYTKKKYEGKYFYLVDPIDDKKVCGLTFSADETIYSSGNTQDDFGTTKENYLVRARIVSHEPTLARVRVDGGEHSDFAEGQLIGTIRGSDVKQAKIKIIEDGMFALHHFGGETITNDPLSSITGGVPLGITAAGIYATTPPAFHETKLGTYLGISGSRNLGDAVTNFEYEENENNKKRTIKLIHPDFIRDVVQSFEELMQS